MHTTINDELRRIWAERAIVCVQVQLQHLPGRPDKKKARQKYFRIDFYVS